MRPLFCGYGARVASGPECGRDYDSHPWQPGVAACPRCGLMDLALVRLWRAVLARLEKAGIRVYDDR